MTFRSRVVGCAALALPLGVCAVSCRQILGIEERHQATDSGAGRTSSPAACAACRGAACDAELALCDGDAECKSVAGCVERCDANDAECTAWCLGSIARPEAFAGMVACSSEACTGKCVEGTCGELRYGSDECDACVRENCCAENAACSANDACANLDFCDKRCLPAGSVKCTDDCKAAYPEGGDDWAARDSCAAGACAEACARGRAWACLEDRRPYEQPAQSGDITFHMTVAEFLSNAPYAGVTVKACERRDFDCKRPFDTTTTDASGRFELTVPSGGGGFDGYLDLSGDTLYPALFYFTPPLVAGGPRGHLQLPSAENLERLVGLLGEAADPERGHLALVPWDCTLAPAPGVSLSLVPDDSEATRYYFAQQVPSLAPTQTGTDPAIGGFVNVRGNTSVTVRATVVAGARVSSDLSFYVRPGTLTTGAMPPSPLL